MKTVLLQQKKELQRLISTLEKSLTMAPEGTLRIAHKGNRTQYYHRETPQDIKGTYIPKEKLPLAQALAQKDYDSRMLKQAKDNLFHINILITELSDSSLTDIFQNMNEYRKELVKPRVLTAEEYIKEWLEEPYIGKNFSETDPFFIRREGSGCAQRQKSLLLIC